MPPETLLDIPLRGLDGAEFRLADRVQGVCLIVNTASLCGFTPQYQALQGLHEKYRERGLHVIGFPCNQFGRQEPGSAAEIGEFCTSRFAVDFQLCAPVAVNGPEAHPLFVELKRRAPGWLGTRSIKWNFTKFLLERRAERVERFAPYTDPWRLEPRIRALLEK